MTGSEKAFELANQFATSTHEESDISGPDGLMARRQMGGELLAAITAELAPIFDQRSDSLIVLVPTSGRWGLHPKGFVRLVADVVTMPIPPVEMLRFEPDLRALLRDLEVALVDMDEPAAIAGAMLVRNVQNILEEPLARRSSRPIRPHP